MNSYLRCNYENTISRNLTYDRRYQPPSPGYLPGKSSPEGGTQTRLAGRFSPARYSFRYHVTGHTLSELRFTAPVGMQLSRSIDIMDQNGQKIAATIALQGQVAIVTFARPVALNSKLSIDLNDVKTIDNSRT